MSSHDFCVVCLSSEMISPGIPLGFSETTYLDKHLCSLFVLRKLLHFPLEECEVLLREGVGGTGSPGEWCSFCVECGEGARKAFGLHLEIAKLVEEMTGIVGGMRKKLKQSLEEEKVSCDLGIGGRDRIRSWFRGRRGDGGNGGVEEWSHDGEDHCDFVDHDEDQVGAVEELPRSPKEGSVRRSNRKRKTTQRFIDQQEEELGRNPNVEVLSNVEPEIEAEDNLETFFDADFLLKKRMKRSRSKTDSSTPKIIKVTGGPKRFECSKCDYFCDNKKTIHRHRQKHFVIDNFTQVVKKDCGEDPNPVPRFECRMCGENVPQKKQFLHMKQKHLTEISEKLSLCHLCDQSFVNPSNLKQHIAFVHEKFKKFICATCGVGFRKRGRYEDHLETHIKKKPFMCDECGLEYTCKDSLLQHKKEIHNFGRDLQPSAAAELEERRQKECRHCGKLMPHNIALRRHIREAHEDLYQHQCDECDATYIHPQALIIHKQSKHSEETAKCEFCGVEVKCQAYLAVHWRRVCKRKPATPQEQKEENKQLKVEVITADIAE